MGIKLDKDQYFKDILKKIVIKIMVFLFILMSCMLAIDSNIFRFNNEIHEFFVNRLDLIFFVILLLGILIIIIKEFSKLEKDYIDLCKKIDDMDANIVSFPTPYKTLEDSINRLKFKQKEIEYTLKKRENEDNDLITYLAHDLRTPLTSIIGYLSMLDEMKDLPNKQREKYIRQLLETALGLEDLINQFFEIARLNNGEFSIHKEKIDLEYFLIQLRDELYPMMKENNHKINISSEGSIFVNVDPNKMKRALENILKNAILYSYANTEIKVKIYQTYKCVILKIINKADTLEEAQIRNMFNKFTRLNLARNSKKVGSGLGLPIAKEIIELHEGKIEVESSNNEVIVIVRLKNK